MNVLKEICLEKRREVEVLKGKFSIDFFTKKKRKNRNNFLNLLRTKDKDKYNLIAEIKKKSPSAGLIRENFDHIEIALNYKEAGAKCLSVLTEKNYFGGKIDFIKDIKEKINIPILRKDFIIDEWQIYESFFYGADCILLILAILDDSEAKKFLKIAHKLDMGVITEIHDYNELQRAIKIGAECIGINNRNLKTLEIDINLFNKLSNHIPQNIVKICESGISENFQLKKINEEGADAFLIGEFLMKQQSIYNATKDLIQK